MRSMSSSELRRTLATTLDSVAEDRAPLLVTRERGKPAVVVLSLDDYASLEETRHLLRVPRNRDRLLEAVEDLDRGGGRRHDLSE